MTTTATSARAEERKKIIAGVAFVAIVLGYLYYQFHTPDAPDTPVTPVMATVPAPVATPRATTSTSLTEPSGNVAGGPPAKTVGTTAAALDPTLHPEAMLVTESVTYAGTGRNIFSSVSAPPPVAIPKPIAPPRPVVVAQVQQPYVDPGPPPPPPIDLKFFGTAEVPPRSGVLKAFLLHGQDVILASAGDVVARRYRVISISATAIQVEDMPNSNKQLLPLLAR